VIALGPLVSVLVTGTLERTSRLDPPPSQSGQFAPRTPVTIVSHSSKPQSGSVHALFSSTAASRELGGSGSGFLVKVPQPWPLC
jgi:hypothetical protein